MLQPVNGAPRVETSFEGAGSIYGVSGNDMGTYVSVMHPDGSLFGEAHGPLMGKGGETATCTGQGAGTMKKDGSVSNRGAICQQSTSAAWSRLSSVSVVIEYEVDPQGKTKGRPWEWK